MSVFSASLPRRTPRAFPIALGIGCLAAIGMGLVLREQQVASLRGANLGGARFLSGNLSRVDMSGANFAGARTKCNMEQAHLVGVNFAFADLSGARLQRAQLATANLASAKLVAADLRNSDLSRANLCGADFRRADLRGADLRDANLARAFFQGALYNGATRWPHGFQPTQSGATLR